MRPYRRPLALVFLLTCVAAAQTGVQPTRVVVRPVANMYSSATTDADVVSQAIYGTTITVLQENNGWAQVQTPDQYK